MIFGCPFMRTEKNLAPDDFGDITEHDQFVGSMKW